MGAAQTQAEEITMPANKYKWRDGQWVGRDGLPMLNQGDRAGPIAAPQVMRQMPEYESMTSGKLIDDRAVRREDMKRAGAVEMDPPKEPLPYLNKRFTKKHGLPLHESVKHGA